MDNKEAVAQFKARWEFADNQGMEGSRVAYALEPIITALGASDD